MHVLRAEKGYIIVGQETDGTVTPYDAGLGWAIGRNKPDFVGKRSLARPAMHAADRRQLVGLRTKDPAVVVEEGAQVVAAPAQAPPMRLIGHVTSSYASAALGRSIALALIEGGRARIGETLFVPTPGGDMPVEVAAPVFYDAGWNTTPCLMRVARVRVEIRETDWLLRAARRGEVRVSWRCAGAGSGWPGVRGVAGHGPRPRSDTG